MLDRHAIGEQADLREFDATTGLQRLIHRIGIDRFHADDLDLGPQPLHISRDAGDQAAAADGHEDRVDRPGMLAQNFHADGALAGNHVRVIVRVHKRQRLFFRENPGMCVGFIVRIAMQHDLRAASAHRVHLDLRRGYRHHNGGGAAQLLCSQRHTLCMIAGGSRDHATRARRWCQAHHLVISAAQLERKHRLQVFALHQHAAAQSLGQAGRRVQRRLGSHVIDAGAEDALQIIR